MPITQKQQIERSRTMLVGRLLIDWVRYDKEVPEGFEGSLVEYARFIADQTYTDDYDSLWDCTCDTNEPLIDEYGVPIRWDNTVDRRIGG